MVSLTFSLVLILLTFPKIHSDGPTIEIRAELTVIIKVQKSLKKYNCHVLSQWCEKYVFFAYESCLSIFGCGFSFPFFFYDKTQFRANRPEPLVHKLSIRYFALVCFASGDLTFDCAINKLFRCSLKQLHTDSNFACKLGFSVVNQILCFSPSLAFYSTLYFCNLLYRERGKFYCQLTFPYLAQHGICVSREVPCSSSFLNAIFGEA